MCFSGAALGLTLALPVLAQEPEKIAACADSARLVLTDLTSSERDAGRVLQTSGAAPVSLLRRGSTERERPVCADGAAWEPSALEPLVRPDAPSLRLLPVRALAESNSGYRRDRNNGTLRGGVGPSASLSAGVELRWKGIAAAIAPRVIYEGNQDFQTIEVDRAGYSTFSNPEQTTIDFPQRFGTSSGARLDPGQSYVRFGTRHFEVGASTENVWLGAAQVYPLLVSSTAPGFPHLFAGTVAPLNIGIGELGVHALWGRLTESDYFDAADSNDVRLFAGLLVEVAPRFLPGLTLGIARVYHETVPEGGFTPGYYLGSVFDPSPFYTGGGNRSAGNGIGAVLARWVLPSAGFEAYAEWSREDTPYDLQDLIREPDWTQAYTLGFHQLVTLPSVRLRWYGELVHLGEAAPVRGGKSFFSYYTHSTVTQGHTQDGQILGASAGPGSDAQIVGVDVFHGAGTSGLWLERTRNDEDSYYRRWARMYGESRHDVEVGIGLRHSMPAGPLQLSGELLYNSRENRNFLRLEDRTLPRLVESNLGLQLRALWRP